LIRFFLAQTDSVQLLILLAHAVVVFLLGVGCMRWLGARLHERQDFVPVAPYFVAITTLYALFLAFHASALWSRQTASEDHFREAVNSIARLQSFIDQQTLELGDARLHLSRYVDAVIEEEWAAENATPSQDASHALEALRQSLIQASERVPAALGNHLWGLFDDIVRTRDERLWIGAHSRRDGSWILVLILGLMSHLAIGFVHADRPRGGALALALFACATTASYVALMDAIDPFANLDTTSYLEAIRAR
jgi:hypothetical protein